MAVGSIAPIRDDKGNIIGLLLLFHDILEHEQAEDQMRKTRIQYEELYQNAREGYAIIDDATGRFTQANQAMLKVLGYSKKELERLRFMDIVDEAEKEYVPHSYKTRLEEKNAPKNHSTKYDCWIKTKAGEKRHINIVEIRTSFVNGTFLSAIDFTEQEKIKQTILQSEKLSSLGQLASGLAHELRNPLAPIRNAVHYLGMDGLTETDVQAGRDVISRQVKVMVRLIDDLLDISRISRNTLDIRKQRVLLATILDDAVESSRPLVLEGGHELTIQRPQVPIELEADPIRLGQVFLNLLNNAARYTKQGGHI